MVRLSLSPCDSTVDSDSATVPLPIHAQAALPGAFVVSVPVQAIARPGRTAQ
ncbi:hypothetical protein Kisp02_32690 [Kineosporia sp. NBRC 101731]|nr:hypothetical protein Kisp02_32690 [Kineosporia sp. NBRC 101731]